MLQEVINMLGNIKDDHDENEQDNGKEERSQELSDNIFVDDLHLSESFHKLLRHDRFPGREISFKDLSP